MTTFCWNLQSKLQLVVYLGLMTSVWAGGYPDIIPTTGEVWPLPQEIEQGPLSLVLDPLDFRFISIGNDCDILRQALERYTDIITQAPLQQVSAKGDKYNNLLGLVVVSLESECEVYPHQAMDEKYGIHINVTNSQGMGIIKSKSIWGILRGLESFSQLLVPDGSIYRIRSTVIKDYPRYTHRGIMIDTARHYIPRGRIEEMLDLMAMNKFNVLHWHIVDDQSFPYQSDKFPKLSKEGAYTQSHIYTAEDINKIVEYARIRGIRIIPEFDTPEHMKSWGPGRPDLLTPCYTDDTPDGTYGPIDPTNEKNFEFLKTFLAEVAYRFPDEHIHLGGDSALEGLKCWRSNPNVTKYLDDLGLPGEYQILREIYAERLFDIVSELPSKKGYIVWEELFDRGIELPDNVIVHIWILHYLDIWKKSVQQVTSAGFQTIMSSCWYLSDYIGNNWIRYYACDPRDFDGTTEQRELVIGGEACIWGEHVDGTNLIPTAWPSACAVGERLWSPKERTIEPDAAAPRLEEQRCRLLRRGYRVKPLFASYCDADLNF